VSDCPLCPTVSLDAARADAPRYCPACGLHWIPEPTPPPRGRIVPVDVVADGEGLAKWLPAITGGALSPAPTIPSGIGRYNGRPDVVDEHHRGLRHACETLSRLNAISRAGYQAECEVIWYAFVVVGPELTRTHKGGREDLVAERFAPGNLRTSWNNAKSKVAAQGDRVRWGESLLVRAQTVYANFAGTDAGRKAVPATAQTAEWLARSGTVKEVARNREES
jgi:hypothetical protein